MVVGALITATIVIIMITVITVATVKMLMVEETDLVLQQRQKISSVELKDSWQQVL